MYPATMADSVRVTMEDWNQTFKMVTLENPAGLKVSRLGKNIAWIFLLRLAYLVQNVMVLFLSPVSSKD